MFTEKDVKYIASLSRIHLNEEQTAQFSKDLEKILSYVKKLEQLDVSDVKPTSHVLPLKNVYRNDEIKPSLTQEQALKFSVEQHNGSFKVPKVIE